MWKKQGERWGLKLVCLIYVLFKSNHVLFMCNLCSMGIGGLEDINILSELFNSLRQSDIYSCICVDYITIIGIGNGLPPGCHQAITCSNAGILLIGLLATNVSEILIKIHTFPFKKIPFQNVVWKMAAFCPQCVKLLSHSYPVICWWSPLLQIMACHLFGTKPLLDPWWIIINWHN